MALLNDPTIQRILDEVNKAASGGVLGQAGSYVAEQNANQNSTYSPMKQSPFNPQQFPAQPPMFYPTPDMFNFDPNMNLPPIDPIMSSFDGNQNGFDLYGSNFYDSVPPNLMSPYQNCKQESIPSVYSINPNQIKTTSIVSSLNNEMAPESYRHFEYPTSPPKSNSTVQNAGNNISNRVTPSAEQVPMTLSETDSNKFQAEQIPSATIDIKTATIDLTTDKDEINSVPNQEQEEVDHPHLSSAGRIFYDPNPQIIQRKGSNSVTYKQNIVIRFLQPPPIPNAGPLIIKEVSSPPQPALPPLVIKQRPTPPKTPPPLIIREKPPPLPASLATKVITRHLPPEPAPPRAVIIERLPPLPPKPRDIIIERWLPYEIVNQKRKVIIERVQKTSKEQQPQPKNVIITYEPVQAKVERNLLKQNVLREDPHDYMNRFGGQLFETEEVYRQARAYGIQDDLNPPTSFIRPKTTMTNNVATGTEYELPTVVNNEHHAEPAHIGNHVQQEILPATNLQACQEDDVLVEEDVTPFYVNSGENLEETLQRLGIDLRKQSLTPHHF